MPSKQEKPLAAKKENTTYVFHLQGKDHRLTYQEAFSYGHTLMNGGHFADAGRIFSRLAKIPNRGPRARIMLSRCAVGLQRYDVCQEILKIAFDDSDQELIEELHTAFVYHKLGMQADAIREMTHVVQQYENLPTACLILGDMFAAVGNAEKATDCWKLAIARDRPEGAVAKAARKQLGASKKLPADRVRQRGRR